MLPDLPCEPIWECAAGDGRLAQAIRGAGYPVIASDIGPRGDGIERRDFLRNDPPRTGLIAITNPPFNEMDRFIARGLQLLDANRLAGLVLLVRWDALTAASRAAAFNRATLIVTCCWRPVWIEGTRGNGRWSNAWISWLPDYAGPPEAHWVAPARSRRQPSLEFPA
jgi:hypothetical protein